MVSRSSTEDAQKQKKDGAHSSAATCANTPTLTMLPEALSMCRRGVLRRGFREQNQTTYTTTLSLPSEAILNNTLPSSRWNTLATRSVRV